MTLVTTGRYIQQQDWEFSELLDDGEFETVEIQIPSLEQAIEQAEQHANKTRRTCYISTSIACIDTLNNCVDDRLLLSQVGLEDVEPIEIKPL